MLKILLTGGPSSGKTSVLNRVQEEFRELGYNVIVVPEAGTFVMEAGIKPYGANALPPIEFQKIVLSHQLHTEYLAEVAAKTMGSDNTIIIYDRGTLDGYAYVNNEEWDQILKESKVSRRELLASYDAVLYLEGSPKFFTKENNPNRYESDAAEALEKGEKVLHSYLSHDNLMVIKPRELLEDKQQEIISIIHNMLGKPVPIKEQRKFLVSDVDLEKLEVLANKVLITQDYLKEENGYEYRVRKVSQGDEASYHFNVQKKVEGLRREIIQEKSLSKREYECLLATKSSDFDTCVKCRYSFVYKEQYYKLDIFEDGLMILEVNVTKENPELVIPDFTSVVEEVTGRKEYANINIARRKVASYGKRKNNCN